MHESVLTGLKRIAKNAHFKALLAHPVEHELSQLETLATKATVFNQGLISELVLASNCGDSITASVSFLSSDSFLASADNLQMAIAKVVEATTMKLKNGISIYLQVKDSNPYASDTCWTKFTANEVRRCYGNYAGVGTTMSGDLCPMAAHQYAVFSVNENHAPEGKLEGMHFWTPSAHPNLSGNTDHLPVALTRGSKRTAFEGAPKEYTSRHAYGLPKAEPAMKKSSRICRLKHWCCEPDSNMWKFLTAIQLSKSDAEDDLHLYLSGAMGRGQIEHRLRVLMALVTTSLTGKKMSATHLSHFLDGLVDVSREICTHYQGLELIVASVEGSASALVSERCGSQRRVLKGVFRCMSCGIPTIGKLYNLTIDAAPALLKYEANPLLYTSVLSLDLSRLP